MKAVILAAGKGERLLPLTIDRPKALVGLRGIPLIDTTLDFLAHHAISEIIVVGGAFFPQLQNHLKNKSVSMGLPIRLIENRNYEKGNILSLQVAAPYLTEEFLLMNADHIYPNRLFPAILKSVNGITAICDFNRTLSHDDMKVDLDPEKRIRKISKTLAHFDGGYIGMTWCGYEQLDTYLKALQTTLNQKGETAVVEDILQTLADQKNPVRIFDASLYPWFEIDTPEELIKAEAVLVNS